MNLYLKAFATALVDHIKGTVPKHSVYNEGGCPTCGGWYEDKGYESDFLHKEIEAFAENYKEPE